MLVAMVVPEMPGTAEPSDTGSTSGYPRKWDAQLAPAKHYMPGMMDKGCMLECTAAATDIDTWVAERKGTLRFRWEPDTSAVAAYLHTAARHRWPALA